MIWIDRIIRFFKDWFRFLRGEESASSMPQPDLSSGLVDSTEDPTTPIEDSWWVLSPPGHGKTCFLQAVCRRLQALNSASDVFLVQWSEESERFLERAESELDGGELPAPTELEGSPRAGFLHKRDGNGSWTWELSFSDRRDGSLKAEEPSLPRTFHRRASCPVVLLDVDQWIGSAAGTSSSLPGRELSLFAHRLAETLRACDTLRPLTVLIVLTKVDRLSSVPPEILEYLSTDPFPGLGEEVFLQEGPSRIEELFSDAYWERLHRNSEILENWLMFQPGGEDLLQITREISWELRFCAVSALGSEPHRANPRQMVLPAVPKRVLDPLIWSLRLSPALVS